MRIHQDPLYIGQICTQKCLEANTSQVFGNCGSLSPPPNLRRLARLYKGSRNPRSLIIGDVTSHFATDNSLHCRRLRGTKLKGAMGGRKSRTRMQIVRWALPVPTSTTTTTHEGAPVCQRARTNDGSRLVGEHRRAPHWPSAPPLSPSTPLLIITSARPFHPSLMKPLQRNKLSTACHNHS